MADSVQTRLGICAPMLSHSKDSLHFTHLPLLALPIRSTDCSIVHVMLRLSLSIERARPLARLRECAIRHPGGACV